MLKRGVFGLYLRGMMKRLKTFRLIGVGIFVIWLVYGIIKIITTTNNNPTKVSEDTVAEYINLFPQSIKSQLITRCTYQSRGRSPISLINYGKYGLTIYKVDTTVDILMDKVVLKLEESNEGSDIVYSKVREPNFKLLYKMDYIKPKGKIILALSGDSVLTTNKNDSLISYYMEFNNFSLRYENENIPDIYAETEEMFRLQNKTTSINLMLLKRNKVMYFLMLCPSKKEDKIEKNILYNILYRTVNE